MTNEKPLPLVTRETNTATLFNNKETTQIACRFVFALFYTLSFSIVYALSLHKPNGIRGLVRCMPIQIKCYNAYYIIYQNISKLSLKPALFLMNGVKRKKTHHRWLFEITAEHLWISFLESVCCRWCPYPNILWILGIECYISLPLIHPSLRSSMFFNEKHVS